MSVARLFKGFAGLVIAGLGILGMAKVAEKTLISSFRKRANGTREWKVWSLMPVDDEFHARLTLSMALKHFHRGDQPIKGDDKICLFMVEHDVKDWCFVLLDNKKKHAKLFHRKHMDDHGNPVESSFIDADWKKYPKRTLEQMAELEYVYI